MRTIVAMFLLGACITFVGCGASGQEATDDSKIDYEKGAEEKQKGMEEAMKHYEKMDPSKAAKYKQ